MRGARYLTKPEQYSLVYDKGRSWVGNLLVVKALTNGLDLSRYGFSVGHRVGKAVTRNRVKRLLREILRIMPLSAGRDIIFIARARAAGANHAQLKKEVDELLSRGRLLKREYERICLKIN